MTWLTVTEYMCY